MFLDHRICPLDYTTMSVDLKHAPLGSHLSIDRAITCSIARGCMIVRKCRTYRLAKNISLQRDISDRPHCASDRAERKSLHTAIHHPLPNSSTMSLWRSSALRAGPPQKPCHLLNYVGEHHHSTKLVWTICNCSRGGNHKSRCI